MRHALAALALSTIALLFACGTTGAVGDACTHPGATSECAAGNVCAVTDAKATECLEICKSQTDCAGGDQCNGVSNTNLSACQPQGQASHGW